MNENIKRLCEIMHTQPAYVCDFSLLITGFGCQIDPAKIEELMTKRGEFDDGKSIRDNVTRVYGHEASDLIQKLIDEFLDMKDVQKKGKTS